MLFCQTTYFLVPSPLGALLLLMGTVIVRLVFSPPQPLLPLAHPLPLPLLHLHLLPLALPLQLVLLLPLLHLLPLALSLLLPLLPLLLPLLPLPQQALPAALLRLPPPHLHFLPPLPFRPPQPPHTPAGTRWDQFTPPHLQLLQQETMIPIITCRVTTIRKISFTLIASMKLWILMNFAPWMLSMSLSFTTLLHNTSD